MNFKEMDDDERQRLIESDEFLGFFMRSTKILEKALDQDDIFFEYGATDNELALKISEPYKPYLKFKFSFFFTFQNCPSWSSI